MTIELLFESAARSLVLGLAVWLGMKAFRVRNTQAQMTAWTVVLLASIVMPVLMRWATVTIPAPPAPLTRMIPAAAPPVVIPQTPPSTIPAPVTPRIDWQRTITAVYLFTAALFMLRMLLGIVLTGRMRLAAEPLHAGWTHGVDVRISAALQVPVTFGSTILLPAESLQWTDMKRRAVLSHERSHVENGDFYVLLLAGLHRAVFWFNPLAWWLQNHLAALAETRSDDAAIEAVGDRPSYAEILLHVAKSAQRIPIGVAMARPATVSRRVERILANAALFPYMAWPKRLLLAGALIPLVVLTAGSWRVQAQAPPPPPPPVADRPAPTPPPPARPGDPPPPPAPRRETTTIRESSRDTGRDSFAIFYGNNTTIDGDSSSHRRARSARNKIQGDYIWFERNGVPYVITDAAMLQRARELYRPQTELGQRQAELGALQARLGEQQGRLGAQQAQVAVGSSNLTRMIDDMRRQMDQLRSRASKNNGNLTHDELSELQSRIGELQSRIGELQSQAGEKQSQIGAIQSELGVQQSILGAQQSELGEEQSRLAEIASSKMRELISEALRNGIARRVE